ncbi:S-adenosylmethionine decarboxylase [Candidatus Woesearchaeota archaeon]|nr:S-adenosylmethionine decarboxylase [Candidatus Woesearchaeota archaeon]
MRGVYIIGYIETRNKRLLISINAIKGAVVRVCKVIGLKIVGKKYHVFKSPKGITYCFILSQSHFVVHTWPEESKVFFDIFTCNEELNEKEYLSALSREFKGVIKELRRVEHI